MMVRQEATRKLGFTITPEEEQLRYSFFYDKIVFIRIFICRKHYKIFFIYFSLIVVIIERFFSVRFLHVFL